jgi:hypothetical protein
MPRIAADGHTRLERRSGGDLDADVRERGDGQAHEEAGDPVVDDDVVVDGDQRRPVGRADLAGGTGAAVDATEDDDDDDEEGQFEGAGDDFGEAVGLDAEGINDDEEEGNEE